MSKFHKSKINKSSKGTVESRALISAKMESEYEVLANDLVSNPPTIADASQLRSKITNSTNKLADEDRLKIIHMVFSLQQHGCSFNQAIRLINKKTEFNITPTGVLYWIRSIYKLDDLFNVVKEVSADALADQYAAFAANPESDPRQVAAFGDYVKWMCSRLSPAYSKTTDVVSNHHEIQIKFIQTLVMPEEMETIIDV